MDDKGYYARTGFVSNSIINNLIHSAKKFYLALNGLLVQEDKSYLRFGQLVHLKVLEANEYDKTVLVYDYSIPKSAQQKTFIQECLKGYLKQTDEPVITNGVLIEAYKGSYSTKESDEKVLEKANKLYKDYTKYFNYLRIKDTKTSISTKESEKIDAMHLSCRNHKSAKDLLFDLPHPLSKEGVDAFNESEILWEYKGIKCKSLIDRFIIDHNTKTIKLVDFKTTVKLHDFKTSFYDYGYDRQLVFYKNAILAKYSDLKDYTFESYIVACDTITHQCKAIKIEEQDLIEAELKITELLDRAKWHIDNNEWDHEMEYYLGDGYEKL